MTIERLDLIQYYALWFGVFLIGWAVVSIVIGATRKARKAERGREETSRGVRAYDAQYFDAQMREMGRKNREFFAVGDTRQRCLICGNPFVGYTTTAWYPEGSILLCQCDSGKSQEKAQ